MHGIQTEWGLLRFFRSNLSPWDARDRRQLRSKSAFCITVTDRAIKPRTDAHLARIAVPKHAVLRFR